MTFKELNRVARKGEFKFKAVPPYPVNINLKWDMKFQNKQNRGNRVPKNRKFSKDAEDGQNSGPRQPNPNQSHSDRPQKQRFIKRDHPNQHKGRPGKGPRKGHPEKRKPEDRDLDRELRDYWVGQKGSKADAGTYGFR